MAGTASHHPCSGDAVYGNRLIPGPTVRTWSGAVLGSVTEGIRRREASPSSAGPARVSPRSPRCSAPRAGGDRGAAPPDGAADAPPGLALPSSCPGRSVRAAPAHRPTTPRGFPVPGRRSGMAPGLLDLVHLTTWAVCAVIKLPQLVAVLRAGSAWGLSVSSLLLELAGLLVFLRYQIYYGYPLETYLEFPVVIAQDAILLGCIMHFSGKVRRAFFYAVVFWVGWYMLTLQKCIIDLAMNLCTLISAASKLVQLQHLWETKDSGQASALTWGMSVYASATRIITTLMTTNDRAGTLDPNTLENYGKTALTSFEAGFRRNILNCVTALEQRDLESRCSCQ
ncbi:solute carrier family 66 member 3 isoform X2 [Onychostruthus taczanowskii]|uniref:solute carrier family 66 member 3 isoform X2 n=1 Tax=Onychostruthus taczanowskii TaxID=356909 RepID=UPI001B806E93|nr:solute carrier family 66 member 3 isoform X2 [Onychostruthus taczanowskii]